MLEAIIHVNQVNPHCELSEEQWECVFRRLCALPGTLKKPNAPSYGYRGVRLTHAGEVISVYKNHVAVVPPLPEVVIRRFHDHCREFEQFLLGIVQPHIPAERYELMVKPSFVNHQFIESYYG